MYVCGTVFLYGKERAKVVCYMEKIPQILIKNPLRCKIDDLKCKITMNRSKNIWYNIIYIS